MEVRIAEFIAFVDPQVVDANFVEEVRGWSYQHKVEYALLATNDHRHLLVRGGHDGIALTDSEGVLGVDVKGEFVPVRRLVWHIHPLRTGPSHHDFDVLDRLGQSSSILYEVNAGATPTVFFRKEHK